MNTIGELYNRLHSAWSHSNALYSKYAQAANISYQEFIFFIAAYNKEGQTQKEICECYSIHKQTLNSTVKRLLVQGYIYMETSPKDKREKIIFLSETGKEYAHRLLAPLCEIEMSVYGMIGDEKLQQMVETTEHINLLFGKMLEDRFK